MFLDNFIISLEETFNLYSNLQWFLHIFSIDVNAGLSFGCRPSGSDTNFINYNAAQAPQNAASLIFESRLSSPDTSFLMQLGPHSMRSV